MTEVIYAWFSSSWGGAALFFIGLFACLSLASYLVHKKRLLPAVPFMVGIGLLTYIFINGLIASKGLSGEPVLQIIGIIVPAAGMLTSFLSYPEEARKEEGGKH